MAEPNQPDNKADKPQKQEKSEKSGKGEKSAPRVEKKEDFGPDFRYLVRILNTDLDGKKPFATALTYVPGVSHRMATIVARETGIPAGQRIGKLTEEQINQTIETIESLGDIVPTWMVNRRNDIETGENQHMVGTEIAIVLREDLNRLKKIRSWRGHRHERKLPTRGQRTKNNGRFGSAVGVQRKAEPGAAPEAAAAAPAAGAKAAAPKADAKPAAAGAAKPAAAGAKPAAPAAGAAKPAAAAGKPAPGGKK